MYFPIFRGRQFELLALRECVERKIISSKIIPIVEPVSISPTLIKTLEKFVEDKRQIAIIYNPQVGSLQKGIESVAEKNKENKEEKDEKKKKKGKELIVKYKELQKNSIVIPSCYVNQTLASFIEELEHEKVALLEDVLFICNNPNNIKNYTETIGDRKPLYNLIPDSGDFRRKIRANRVMCEDRFVKQARNTDYTSSVDEFFSSDHLYYEEDGYKGFSDYSIVGQEYSESGFSPKAVVIHIVYFDQEKNLKIIHFVSDSNNDAKDTPKKYSEALEKLVKWNRTMKLETAGIREFEETYQNQKYPGLGYVKKLSIMHHLELMSHYLEENKK